VNDSSPDGMMMEAEYLRKKKEGVGVAIREGFTK